MPTSILRRYTPSTCTLEIIAKESPLSRWMGRPLLSQARFHLYFDGPHLPADRHIMIRGDRHQLDSLCDITEAYVQDVLTLSPARLDTLLSLTASESTVIQMMAADVSENDHTQGSQPHKSSPETGIALHASRGLKHVLHFGELATDESGLSVELSTLELFDLANALDDYRAETFALPSLERPRSQAQYPWLQIVAVVLLAVGGMTAVTRFLGGADSTVQTASSPENAEEAGGAISQDNLQAANDPSATDAPNSAQTDLELEQLPSLDDPLSSDLDLQDPPSRPAPSAAGNAGERQPQTTSPRPNSANSSRSQLDTPPTIPPELAALPPVERQNIPSSSGIPNESGNAESGSGAIAPSTALSRSQPLPNAPSSESSLEQSLSPNGDQTSAYSIPQLEELQELFVERWQPPSELTRNLEYRLTFNSDGTLQRVEPLGQTAATYLDRTRMPAIGELIVSPFSDNQIPQVRLILAANGNVETFIEYRN